MKSILRVLMCLLTLSIAPLATPQARPPPTQPWSDITEVVVRAHVPGPAMWKLTRDGSSVWVMGTLHVAPKDMTWNATRFRHILDGAHVLILPRVVNDDPVSEQDMELPGSQQLANVVSPATYAHFQAILKQEDFDGLPTGLTYTPAWAGSWLIVRVYAAHGITTHIVPPEVADLCGA